MAETKRYNVGPAQGYRHPTVLKLTEKQAKKLGLGSGDVANVTMTADKNKARGYDDAMQAQEVMRDREREAAARVATDAPPADAPVDAEAETKKRGAKDK